MPIQSQLEKHNNVYADIISPLQGCVTDVCTIAATKVRPANFSIVSIQIDLTAAALSLVITGARKFATALTS